jgi:ketosteroid isomerase-like protein
MIYLCTIVITMTSGIVLAQTTPGTDNRAIPGTEGRPIQGRSPAPPPPGPLVKLVTDAVDAYNKGDISYFEKIFADDILWVDEDGHEMTTKMWALYLLNRQMTSTPKRTMSVHDVATGTWGDTAWVAFAYTIDDGVHKRIGMNTSLFKKSGSDWKLVLMHGSINAPAFPH